MSNVKALLDPILHAAESDQNKEGLLQELCEFLDKNKLKLTPVWNGTTKRVMFSEAPVNFPEYKRINGPWGLFRDGTESGVQLGFVSSQDVLESQMW